MVSPGLGMESKYGCYTFFLGGGISVNFLQLYKASLSRPLSVSSATVNRLDARLPHYLCGLHAINMDGQEELQVANFRCPVDVVGQL
jgi:hypothetical protein